MPHEQSSTIERDGRHYNVYGRNTPKAGQPLPLLFTFESESYATNAEAVAAAKRRSDLIDPQTEQPRPGSPVIQGQGTKEPGGHGRIRKKVTFKDGRIQSVETEYPDTLQVAPRAPAASTPTGEPGAQPEGAFARGIQFAPLTPPPESQEEARSKAAGRRGRRIPSTPEGEIPPHQGDLTRPTPIPFPAPYRGGPAVREGEMPPPALMPGENPFIAPPDRQPYPPMIGEQVSGPGPERSFANGAPTRRVIPLADWLREQLAAGTPGGQMGGPLDGQA